MKEKKKEILNFNKTTIITRSQMKMRIKTKKEKQNLMELVGLNMDLERKFIKIYCLKFISIKLFQK